MKISVGTTCGALVPAIGSVQQGLDLRLIADLLGHVTLQISMHFSHLAKEEVKIMTSAAMER